MRNRITIQKVNIGMVIGVLLVVMQGVAYD
jgi:hypothetical protein